MILPVGDVVFKIAFCIALDWQLQDYLPPLQLIIGIIRKGLDCILHFVCLLTKRIALEDKTGEMTLAIYLSKERVDVRRSEVILLLRVVKTNVCHFEKPLIVDMDRASWSEKLSECRSASNLHSL